MKSKKVKITIVIWWKLEFFRTHPGSYNWVIINKEIPIIGKIESPDFPIKPGAFNSEYSHNGGWDIFKEGIPLFYWLVVVKFHFKYVNVQDTFIINNVNFDIFNIY